MVTPPGVPVIPAGYGDLYKADFAGPDSTPATLAAQLLARKLRPVTFLDAKPADNMRKYTDYSTKNLWIRDGVLHFGCTRKPDGRYDGTYLGTIQTAKGGDELWKFQYGRIDFPFKTNVGYRTWQTPLWCIGWVSGNPVPWYDQEIDPFEAINGKLTFNIHPPGNIAVASIAPPADLATVFHMGTVIVAPTYVEVLLDGTSIGRWNGTLSGQKGLVMDSKVGIPWATNQGPTAQTPDDVFVEIPWITVTRIP